MPEYTTGGIQYPIAGDLIKQDSVEAKLANDMKSLAQSANTAINVEGERAEKAAIDDATEKYGGLPAKVSTVEGDLAGRPVALVYQLVPQTKTFSVIRGTPLFNTPAKFDVALAGLAAPISYPGAVPEPDGDFTIECWFNMGVIPPSGAVDIIWGMNHAPWLGIEPVTGKAWLSMSGAAGDELKTSGSVCDGSWHHLAVVMNRNAGKTTLVGFWLDGAQVAGSITNAAATWNDTLTIRGRTITGFDMYEPGRVDELRVSRGNRYPAAFTPQTERFDPDGKTLVLAHLDELAFFQGIPGYPARPSITPDGAATYVGPVQPTDWKTYDVWRKV